MTNRLIQILVTFAALVLTSVASYAAETKDLASPGIVIHNSEDIGAQQPVQNINGTKVGSQKNRPYFVDGYHGGVYGHYPVMTYTKFMADQLDAHPDWRICLEIEPETWDTVAVKTPIDYERFKSMISSPRIEFTNPAYAQPYMYNISGESIIRQLQYGMDKIKSHFPDVEFVTYAVEEPCFTNSLPMILSQAGFKYASIKCPNTCWGGYSAPFGKGIVEWTSPDGSTLTAVPRYQCEALQDSSVWQTIAWGNTDEYIRACEEARVYKPVGMCYQDAGWTYGPWLGYGDKVRNNSQYVTWREYFEIIAPDAPKEVYNMSQEDVRAGLMWGSQVLQRLSRQVRRTENNIVMAEKIGSMETILSGRKYRQALIDEAWRTLMLSQHHDCWIVPYNRLNKKGTWADNVSLWTAAADACCKDAIASVISEPEEDSAQYISVFNTVAAARESVVKLGLGKDAPKSFRLKNSKGHNVPFAIEGDTLVFKASAPSFGLAVYKIEPSKRSCAVRTTVSEHRDAPVTVSTDLYSVTFDPIAGGAITSLIEKNTGREFADKSSERRINELRGFFYDEDKWLSSTDSPADVTVEKSDGIRTKVTVKGEIASVPFVQTIIFEDGKPLISCDAKVFWNKNVGIGKYRQKDTWSSNKRAFYDDRFKLNVLFPFAIENPDLYKDAPFDVCRSLEENTWYDSWDSIKHNVIFKWVSLEGDKSAAVLSDHTTSYTYGPDFPLSLTFQFSGHGLWGRDYTIEGSSQIRYAIFPYEGKWQEVGVQGQSEGWNEPLYAEFSAPKEEASLVSVDNTALQISAMYSVEGSWIMRLYNSSSEEETGIFTIGFPFSSLQEVNLLGERISSVGSNGNTFAVEIPSFGIKNIFIRK